MTKAYIVHYCDDKFPHQDDAKWNAIIDEVKTIDPDKIIVLSSTEVAVENIYGPFFDKIGKYLKRTGKVVNVVTPHSTENLRPNIICEKTYGNVMAALPNFLCSANKPFHWDFGSGAVPPYRESYQFPYLYSCYNVRVAEHRIQMVDTLARENLIDKGMVTFHYPEKAKWKYYDGKKRSDEAAYSKESHDQFRYPASFQKCFVDIVAETWHEPRMFHVTEKTLRSIAFFKPFLALSCKGFYKDYLCDYFDLELYDEIFDYSFDDIESLEDRINGIANNIKKLENLTPRELSRLYISLIPKLIRNKSKLIDILYDKNKIVPDAFKFMFTEDDVTLYGMTENSLFGYMYKMGWCKQYKINRGIE
jgi:uncharacterized protein YdcH (DUF465 family)